MTELLTAAQMRAIEKAAIDSGQVTGLELMERAGRGVVEAIFEEWPELAKTSHRAVVLCGPGNNGGDGFVVARLLKEWGWEVEVFLCGDAAKLPPDARVNYERWGGCAKLDDLSLDQLLECDLILDAFFGTGLTRGFKEAHAVNEGFHRLMADDFWLGGSVCKPFVVAVDMPSGIDSDSGKKIDPYLESSGQLGAHLTVAFHRAKLGHYQDEGPRRCGALRVADIGLESNMWSENGRCVELNTLGQWAIADLGKLGRHPLDIGHKYGFGHALILTGPSGKTGAARLAARGALRIGAGLVTVACPPEALAENAAQLNAIMLAPVADAAGLAEVLKDERKNALCLGPGLGLDERAVGLVAQALGVQNKGQSPAAGGGEAPAQGGGRGLPGVPPGVAHKRALVLDADSLTILSREPDLFAALHERCVLTPHAGEFARLFPDIADKLNAPATKGPAYSKVDATREAAARAGCVVLFKGADTVIAAPDGRCAINSAHYERAAPWLATAGSGDVLSGFITGLLARGFGPMHAAETAAWLHVECALAFGPGLIAEDLPEQLPGVFRKLGL